MTDTTHPAHNDVTMPTTPPDMPVRPMQADVPVPSAEPQAAASASPGGTRQPGPSERSEPGELTTEAIATRFTAASVGDPRSHADADERRGISVEERAEEAAAAALERYIRAARAPRPVAPALELCSEYTAAGKAAAAGAADRIEVERPVAAAAPGMEITASERVTEIWPVTEAAKMRVAGNGDETVRARRFSAPAPRPDEGTSAVVTPTRAPPVEVPEHILAQLRPKHRPVMRITWRRLPIIAGENAGDFFELLYWAVDEWRPLTSEELFLVKQLVDSEWEALRFQEFRMWLLNMAIAEGLVAQLVDSENENGGDASDRIVHRDPGLEPCVDPSWLRAVRRMTLAAVAGDKDAIVQIETRIGPDEIGMGPLCVREFERSVPTYVFADRMLNAALARRDYALRRLAKLAAERGKRIEVKQATVADLSLSEYVKTKIAPTNAERAELSFDAARATKQIPPAANATTDESGSES